MKKVKGFKVLLIILTAIFAALAGILCFAPKAQESYADDSQGYFEISGTSHYNTKYNGKFKLDLYYNNTTGASLYNLQFAFTFDDTALQTSGGVVDVTSGFSGGITASGSEITVYVVAPVEKSDAKIHIGYIEFSLVSGHTLTDGETLNFAQAAGSDPLATSATTGTILTPSVHSFSISFSAPSNKATLTNLSLTNGVTLSPAFNSATKSYTATVPYATSSTQVNATPATGATYMVNNTTNRNVSLTVGPNTINIVVTAEDKTTKETYTVKITRQEGEKTADLTEVKLTKGDKTLTGNISGTDVTFNESIEYADKDGWTLAAKAGGKATVTAGNGPVTLTGGDNTVTVTVQPQQGTATNFTVKINVVQPSTDTTLKGDPKVFNGTEELTVKVVSVASIEVYSVSFPEDTQSLTVKATPTDDAATVKIQAFPARTNTLIGEYNPDEAIPLGENVERLVVVVTAQNGTPTEYTIVLNKEKVVTQDPTNPDQPTEKPKFITFNFGDSELEMAKDETDKKYEVPKGTTSLEFSLKVIEGVTVNVLYGAKEVDETGTEAAGLRALVAYAEETTEEGTVKKYRAELAEGNNSIVMSVNESGIAGDEVIYALNVNRPVEAGSDAGWIAAVVVLSVLLVAAIVVLVVFIILKKKNDDGDDGDGTPAAVVEETPEYTVKFEMKGHGKQVKKQKTEKGLVTEPEAPVAQGYVFGGWYKDEKCTEEFDFAQTVEKDLTVYAQWTEEPKPEPVVEEKVAQEKVVEEAPAVEEEPAQEPKKEEKPTEEAPAEEPKKEEKPTEEKPTEEAVAEEQPKEEEENGDETTIKIRNVLTHKEKYENLSHEQRVFYDELKMRALTVPGTVLSTNRSNETVRLGQKRIIKLMIRRDYVVACFFAENESVTNLKKALRGKDIRINTKETEIPIYDVNSFEAAEEMLQILIESIYRR